MSQDRRFKDAIYDQLARIGKAVASPRRLELLDLLCQGPRTVEVLAHHANQSVANTSQHLQVLRAARLVEAERDGRFITYRLADDEVSTFFAALRGLAESRLAEIERVVRMFLESRGGMEQVDRTALIERVRRGAVTLLDVRPEEEYRAGHIPGAISVPLAELDRRLSTLPRDREIVAYCRGPYCVLAIEAVQTLRSRGFEAVRLEDGVPEWRARGLDVVADEPRESGKGK
jgi:rhodanese-related sulfurtransferase